MKDPTPKTALEAAARLIAHLALKGLVDKGGKPAFHHACRVAAQQKHEPGRIVAYLHDLVEDTVITLDDIESAFGPRVRKDVDALTRRPAETYRSYIRRLKASTAGNAVAVKLADLRDHLEPERLHNLNESMKRRYESALEHLLGESLDSPLPASPEKP